MFVLTHMNKVVQESSDPNMGLYLFIALVAIIVFSIVEFIRYRKWKRDFDAQFNDKNKDRRG